MYSRVFSDPYKTMLECPSCKSQANKLVATKKELVCSNCYKTDTPRNTNLHMRNGTWGKMTFGKSREIDSRGLAEDGRTVINRLTGKPTQY